MELWSQIQPVSLHLHVSLFERFKVKINIGVGKSNLKAAVMSDACIMS